MKFPLMDRLILTPVEIVGHLKYSLLAAVVFLILSGLGTDIYSLDRVLTFGIVSALLIFITLIFGSVLPPVFLPVLPFRSFSIKGLWVGLIIFAGLYFFVNGNPGIMRNNLALWSWLFIITAIVSFLSMNFTGSSTYTSLSGVLKEMKIAVPAQIITALIGIGLWLTARFI